MKAAGRRPLLILGAGLFAQEIADLVSDGPDWEVVGFVEGIDPERCRTPLLGLPVHWIDAVGAFRDSCRAICAVGSPARKGFIERASLQGLTFATFVHPKAHASARTTLGEGTIVGPGVIVASHTVVGRHVLLNRGSLIGHHCDIDDYATISPGANIAGKSHVGECACVGMGAVVIDGLSLGRHSLVAAGAVVTRDVPDGVRVCGIPARAMKAAQD